MVTESKGTMTFDEACQYLGVSGPTLRAALRRKEVPHVRIGRRILFSRASLNAFISGQGQPVTCGA